MADSQYPSGDASWNPALRSQHFDTLSALHEPPTVTLDDGNSKAARSNGGSADPDISNVVWSHGDNTMLQEEVNGVPGAHISEAEDKLKQAGEQSTEDGAESSGLGSIHAIEDSNVLEQPAEDTSPVSRNGPVLSMSVPSQSMEYESLVAAEEVAHMAKVAAEKHGSTTGERPADQALLVEEQEERTHHEGADVNYEHQGDTTEADLAVAEASSVSLLNETAAAPAIEPQQDSNAHIETPERLDDSLGSYEDLSQPHRAAEAKSFEWDTLDDSTDFDEVLGKSQQKPGASDDAAVVDEIVGTRVLEDVQDTKDMSEVADVKIETIAESGGTQESDAGGHKTEDIEDLWAAALDDDDLLDAGAPATTTSVSNNGSVDPSGFFDDDDDGGFLDENSTSHGQQPTAAPIGLSFENHGQQASSQYLPNAGASVARNYQESFGPRPASTPSSFLPPAAGPYSSAPISDRRPQPKSSGSFVDKSKAGYSSPYDLPTEIVGLRKRQSAAVLAGPAQTMAPPPRSSSMQSVGGVGATPGPARPPSIPSGPPSATFQQSSTPSLPGPPQHSPKKASRDSSGFFADLPMASKPKARFTPAPAPGPASTTIAGPPQVPRTVPQPPIAAQSSNVIQGYDTLRQPERLPIYPNEPPSAPLAQPHGVNQQPNTSRYSPAPTFQQTANRFSPAPPAPPQHSRYAAAPQPPQTAAQKAHAFIPKTSSPLAYHDDQDPVKARQGSVTSVSQQTDLVQAMGHRPRLSEQTDDQSQIPGHSPQRIMTPPYAPNKMTSAHSSPRSASRYAPSTVPEPATAGLVSPPQRPRTQSPLHTKTAPSQSYVASSIRRTSTFGAQQAHLQQTTQSTLALPSRRQFSADLSFDIPQDERAQDPLERWKGHPIFRWAPSGILVSSMPKQAPFYAAGHAIPVLKCSAGAVVVHDTKTTFPLHDADNRFPGPLQGKGKGKKKDVISWLASKIEAMEKLLGETLLDPGTPRLIKQRTEEKVILWKVVKLMVEMDNSIEGKPAIDEAMRRLLVPNDIDAQSAIDTDRQKSISEPVDPSAVTEIRKLLFEGQREKAVWYATERRLWSHAMLIASTMGPDMWKQLIHEFVKSQVKGSGDGVRSLAALYEVFAGNWEESTDELVPPSAQAGFSMVNTTTSLTGPGNGVDGLEKWRETLSLILSNRSANDGQAIAALGKLLAKYGRVEASHTCFLFAKTHVSHGGADDPEASFVLLGADHRSGTNAVGSDLDPIMLTEVYEYIQSLSPTAGVSTVFPHLQPYKLVHALELAEHGLRSEAQSYCESIFTSIKSSTKASPYYHMAFTTAVDELNRCLSQAPQTASSSGLLSKFSSDKVSTGVFKSFNKFVAGDDDDAASTTSGPGEGLDSAGPFAKVAASPSISRAASSADLYGAMQMSAGMNGSATFSSPLSPNNGFVPLNSNAAPSMDPAATGAGRYTPQLAGVSRASAARPYEPQRTASGYVPPTAASRTTSKTYSPYAPQPAEDRKPGYNSYAPSIKPEPSRSSSDYGVPYTPAQEYSPEKSLPPTNLQPPQGLGSPYKHRPSPLSAESSPPSQNGYIPSLTQSPSSLSGPPAMQNGGYKGPAEAEGFQSAGYLPVTPSYEPPSAGFEPHVNDGPESVLGSDAVGSQTYQPPEAGYAPPTYEPYEPAFADDEPAETDSPKPKKKSFMDLSDDESLPAKSTNGPSTSSTSQAAADKAAADRAADEAFRKAAEADAQRDKEAKEVAAKKGGWFGGWFAGKKEDDLQQQPKAVRAKLGEENSFYFDKDLGKWVNKKAGKEEQAKAAPTPPPPRAGPPSRAVSAAIGGPPSAPPGSGPPSRVASGVQLAGSMGPPSSRPGSAGANGTPPPPLQAGAGPSGLRAATPAGGLDPPSRPGTGLSTASSIDDLIGAPQAKKGTVKGKKRGGRYVDVMAK